MWLNVLKVNPRANIYGNYKSKEPTLLQQETDDDAMVTTIEEIVVDHLADKRNLFEDIDFDAGDAEVEDESQCNLSSSDDEDGDEEQYLCSLLTCILCKIKDCFELIIYE